MKTKTPIVATELRFNDSQERVVAGNGEVNAGSKKELLERSTKLMEMASKGEVVTENAAVRRAELAKQHAELVKAAYNDPVAHRVIGEKMAENLYMTSNRKGFCRRFLNRIELKQGEIPRFPVRLKNVQAFWFTSPTRMETDLVTDKWLMPPEFQIGTRPFIPQNEINQSTSDVLDEKYVEALEAIMVTEDRLWMNAIRAMMGVDNNQTAIAGTLTPLALMNVRQQVARWGLKVPYLLMASDLYTDIVGDSTFIQAIEPVSRHELIMTGELAVLYGMTIISEAYRHPEHKVLNQGEFVVVSDPLTHGAYSDRGGIDSQPIDTTTEHVLGRGWVLAESFSLAIANSRSAAVGIRV
jgi:hypothetical protein